MAESFVKSFRRDYVYLNEPHSGATVMNPLSVWLEDHEVHPHKGLRLQIPREYRRQPPAPRLHGGAERARLARSRWPRG
jgi:hypothetical protein